MCLVPYLRENMNKTHFVFPLFEFVKRQKLRSIFNFWNNFWRVVRARSLSTTRLSACPWSRDAQPGTRVLCGCGTWAHTLALSHKHTFVVCLFRGGGRAVNLSLLHMFYIKKLSLSTEYINRLYKTVSFVSLPLATLARAAVSLLPPP